MIFAISNCPIKKMSFEDLDKAIVFGFDYLKLDDSIEVSLSFDKQLDTFGESDIFDGDIEINIRSTLPRRELFATLFHELCHVSQMLRGDLRVGEGNRNSTWKGIEYFGEYLRSPWELEATKQEHIMMEIFENDKKPHFSESRN